MTLSCSTVINRAVYETREFVSVYGHFERRYPYGNAVREMKRNFSEHELSDACESVALEFATLLIQRDFGGAASLLSSEGLSRYSERYLRASYDEISKSGAFDSCFVVSSLQDWPEKDPGDMGLYYVSLEGEFLEGVTLTVSGGAQKPGISLIEWGRP